MEYIWYTQKGQLTADNRDYCGIAEAHGTTMCILADGATGSPNGGALAKSLVSHLVVAISSLKQPPSHEELIKLLEEIHRNLRQAYPADSASYIILMRGEGPTITTLHAGDCRLGRVKADGGIQWLTQVHCLTNAFGDIDEEDLRLDPDRHLLTRSFRSKHFQRPDCTTHDLAADTNGFVLASDGFWADLTAEEQSRLLTDTAIKMDGNRDDASFLFVTAPADCQVGNYISDQSAENLLNRKSNETNSLTKVSVPWSTC